MAGGGMRRTNLLLGLAILAGAACVGRPSAAGQTPPTTKTSPSVATTQPSAEDDVFTPLLRGTPGGRMSGGTRGLSPRPVGAIGAPTSPPPRPANVRPAPESPSPVSR